mmetsp:Transcript_5277/g.7459  ORF Transcript_5277/g.7459 Transcript_5277/m.7459 type:complete len:122 (+) Transcript_5277:70-435(+)
MLLSSKDGSRSFSFSFQISARFTPSSTLIIPSLDANCLRRCLFKAHVSWGRPPNLGNRPHPSTPENNTKAPKGKKINNATNNHKEKIQDESIIFQSIKYPCYHHPLRHSPVILQQIMPMCN